MIWYVCFAVALLFLVAVAYVACARWMGRLRVLWVLGGIFAAAFALYVPPFFLQYNFIPAFFGNLLHTLQLVLLGGDYLEFQEFIEASVLSNTFQAAYFIVIALFFILLPVAFATTAVTLIWQCLTNLRVVMLRRRRRTLHVLTQLNQRSEMLARDIRREDAGCDILFLDSGEEGDFSELRRELHCSVLDEHPENIRADAKRRQVFYYCISSDEEKNLNDTLAVLASFTEKETKEQQNGHILLFSSDLDAELLIDSVQKGFVNLSVIDEEQMAVYGLLEEYPLLKFAQNGKISVLISGFTQSATAALRAVAWIGQVSGYSLSITLLARDAETQIADFQCRYPGLFSGLYDIHCFSYATDGEFASLVQTYGRDANYVLVCEEEKVAVEKSVVLRRLFYRLDPSFSQAPPIFTYMEQPQRAEALARLCTAEINPARRMSYGILPFGTVSKVYTLKNLVDSPLEGIAKNVHLMYEKIFAADGKIDAVASMERYNLFEVNKRSSRANALHIRYKLLSLGLDYSEDPDAEAVDFEKYLTEDRFDGLIRAEHDRWQAFLESEGWETATVEMSLQYQASGISKGRHNCPLLKLHPYICPFDELTARSEALNLPDSTIFDRDLIRNIPQILQDPWGVAGRKFKIVPRS